MSIKDNRKRCPSGATFLLWSLLKIKCNESREDEYSGIMKISCGLEMIIKFLHFDILLRTRFASFDNAIVGALQAQIWFESQTEGSRSGGRNIPD
jgi:hypothetical protein